MTTEPENSSFGFQVTPKDIYDEVRKVHSLVEPLPAIVADHEQRIRLIETGKLGVGDYNRERKVAADERGNHEDRLRHVEGTISSLSGGKAMLAWGGTVFGGSALGFLLIHVFK